ncbi:MAG: hypothetical protein GF307_09725 [candidate division Zixibacteria bacterium]|nr:hypothetical protein [candidate division Zixibacteria bacterium]
MKIRGRIFFFTLGLCSILFQTYLIREFLANYTVNSILLGYAIFIWMAGGTIGVLIGLGRLSTSSMYRYGFNLLSLTVLAGIVFLRLFPKFLGYYPGEIVPLTIKMGIGMISILPSAIISGLLFGNGYCIYQRQLSASKAYLLDIMGFAIGGIMSSVLIFPYIIPFDFFLVSIALLSIFSLLLFGSRLWIFSMLIIALSVTLAAMNVNKAISKLKWAPYEIKAETDSPYGRVTAIQQENQYSVYFNSQKHSTIPDRISSELTVHLPALQLESHDRVLVLGGNIEALSRELKKYDFRKIDYVAIDEELVSTYRELGESKEQDYTVHITDPRNFLRNTETTYDLIILPSVSYGLGISNRFYTNEFFELINKTLNPGGVFCFSLDTGGSYIPQSISMALKSVYNAVSSNFSNYQVIYTPDACFLCSHRAKPFDINPEYYTDRIRGMGITNSFFNPGYIGDILSPFRQTEFMARMESTDIGKSSNTDFRPITSIYAMLSSEELGGSFLSNMMLGISAKPALVFIFGLLGLLLLLVIPFTSHHKVPGFFDLSLITAAVSGFTVMFMELTALELFQSYYGSVYLYISFAIALFMVSNAIGLEIFGFYIRRFKPILPVLISQWVAISLIIMVGILTKLFTTFPDYYGILSIAIIVVSGFCGGMVFSASVETIVMHSPGRSPAFTYGSDLYGAGIAAMVVMPLLLPILGVNWALLLLGVLNSLILMLIFICIKLRVAG